MERPAVANIVGSGTDWDAECAEDGAAHNACQDDALPGTVGTRIPIHSGGWNYLFCDGHVKWLLPQQTVGGGVGDSPLGYWALANN